MPTLTAHHAHAEVDRLRHMAATEPRRFLAHVQAIPTTKVRHMLALALNPTTEGEHHV